MTIKETGRKAKRAVQKGLETTADVTTAALRGGGDVVGEATSVG